MGLFDRLKGTRDAAAPAMDATSRSSAPPTTVTAYLHTGDDDLEIVGEASYQTALWAICHGAVGDRIRHRVVAVLVPEPQNAYDAHAISIQVEGKTVGYLARDAAVQFGPGLHRLMAKCGGYVALEGVIVGGGHYDDGPGRLGVWLEHNPRDFGVESSGRAWHVGPATRPVAQGGSMRTGFTEAWLTDVEDESYDLSWFDDLPEADRPAIASLRNLLESDQDLIDRHFQFAELESRLYRCRDLYVSALDEYDVTCRLHDSEMEMICHAFRAKWGKVPLLETYRQMAIRQQKKKDWRSCLWWAERGLALYGDSAAREEAVEDLLKRRNRALAKLEAPMTTTPRYPSDPVITAELVGPAESLPQAADRIIEVLSCAQCEASFERVRVRGRKPLLCPGCRSEAGA